MKVVLDTNILISAFVFPGGPPEDVFRAALDGRVELVTSPPLLAEFGRVLQPMSLTGRWLGGRIEAGRMARVGWILHRGSPRDS